jgi:hypothetical protein
MGACLMRDLLRTEVLIAALLASSFTMVGVVALWAARWPRHWFMRASVVVAFLSPLLLIPAYELFLIFALQAGPRCGGRTLVAVATDRDRLHHARFFNNWPGNSDADSVASVLACIAFA